MFGCEQDPDVVVFTSTPLDAASVEMDTSVQEPPPMQEPSEPSEPNEPNLCGQITQTYIALQAVLNNREPCSWAFDDEMTFRVLRENILNRPPATLVAEIDPPPSPVCAAIEAATEATTGVPQPARFFLIDINRARLCPGYCKALGIWLTDTRPIVDSCLRDF
jgi:hypothetical protein